MGRKKSGNKEELEKEGYSPWATLSFYRNPDKVLRAEFIVLDSSESVKPVKIPKDFPIEALKWETVAQYDVFGSREKPMYRDSKGVEVPHILRQSLHEIVLSFQQK